MTLFRSVSTLSLSAFDTTLAAVGGAPLAKCERSPTPPLRGFVDPFMYTHALTRVRTRTQSRSPRYLSPASSVSDAPTSPTTPTDQHDGPDYAFEFEAADPAYHYELDNPSSPTTRMRVVEHLDKCLERSPSVPKALMFADTTPPYSPRTAAQRYAAAHRASIDANSCRLPLSVTHSRSSSYDSEDEDELDELAGIVWMGKRDPPTPEYFRLLDTFRRSIGSALDPNAPIAPGHTHAQAKKNPPLMKKIVGAWRERRRRRSTK
jgi:hypothetical protein